MIIIKSGTPTPTLTPMMTLLLTPPVSPSTVLVNVDSLLVGFDVAVVEVDVFGIYDTGLPLVASTSFALAPNATVFTTASLVVVGNAASVPTGTAATNVLVTTFLTADWSEAGQFTSPVDKHTVAICVTTVVDVVIPSSLPTIAELVTVGAAAVFVPAQASASVVYQIGTCVFGAGPHECVPTASVAPAFAPRSIEYSSTTCRAQSSLSVEAVTFVTNFATSAQTPVSMPALNLTGNLPMERVVVSSSKPERTPRRRTAVRMVLAPTRVTGRNSKLPPLLRGDRLVHCISNGCFNVLMGGGLQGYA